MSITTSAAATMVRMRGRPASTANIAIAAISTSVVSLTIGITRVNVRSRI